MLKGFQPSFKVLEYPGRHTLIVRVVVVKDILADFMHWISFFQHTLAISTLNVDLSRRSCILDHTEFDLNFRSNAIGGAPHLSPSCLSRELLWHHIHYIKFSLTPIVESSEHRHHGFFASFARFMQ